MTNLQKKCEINKSNLSYPMLLINNWCAEGGGGVSWLITSNHREGMAESVPQITPVSDYGCSMKTQFWCHVAFMLTKGTNTSTIITNTVSPQTLPGTYLSSSFHLQILTSFRHPSLYSLFSQLHISSVNPAMYDYRGSRVLEK